MECARSSDRLTPSARYCARSSADRAPASSESYDVTADRCESWRRVQPFVANRGKRDRWNFRGSPRRSVRQTSLRILAPSPQRDLREWMLGRLCRLPEESNVIET